MKSARYISLLVMFFFVSSHSFAQNKKYAPFAVTEDNVIKLKIPDAALTKKYGAIFKKHNRDVTDVSSWDEVIEQVAADKDGDMFTEGGFNVDTDDEGVAITVPDKAGVERFMKAVRPTLTNTKALDDFLTRLDKMLNKKK